MTGKKRVLRAALLALPVALLVLLPQLLSLPPVSRQLLGRLNTGMPGTLAVASCSFSWLDQLSCQELRYHDPEGGILLTAPRLLAARGLLALLAAPSHFGEVSVDSPILTFTLPSSPAASPHPPPQTAADRSSSPTSVAGEGMAPRPADQARSAWWERVTCRLRVSNAQALLAEGREDRRELAREINLDAGLARGTVTYSLGFRSGQGGAFNGQGFLNLPTARQSLLEALVSSADVTLKDIALAPFLQLASAKSDLPGGEGLANGTFHVVTAGTEEFKVRGTAELRDVRLAGGFLGDDRPVFDRLDFTVDGGRNAAEGWHLATLALNADPLRFEATGKYDREHRGSLVAKGTINLPVLAGQFPRSLALGEGMAIKDGTADFSLVVSGDAHVLNVKARCRTDQFRAAHGDQVVAWDTPLSLALEASRQQEGTTVGKIEVISPFFLATGSGSPEDFSFQASADLEQMSRQLGTLFSLPLEAGGRTELSGVSRRLADGKYKVEAKLHSNSFSLHDSRRPLLPAHPLMLSAEAQAAGSWFTDRRLSSLRLDGEFWAGRLRLAADRLDWAKEAEASVSLDGSLDLARLTEPLRSLGWLAPNLVVDGRTTFTATGAMAGGRMSVDAFASTIDALGLSDGRVFYNNPKLALSLGEGAGSGQGQPVAVDSLIVAESWQDFADQSRPGAVLDWKKQILEVHRLQVHSATLTAGGSLRCGDWSKPAGRCSADLRAEGRVPVLADLLKAAGYLQQTVDAAGTAGLTLQARAADEEAVAIEFDLRLRDLVLRQGKKELFADPEVRLKAMLGVPKDGAAALHLPSLSLQARPVALDGKGEVRRGASPVLFFKGSLQPKYEQWADPLAAVTGERMVLAGRRPGMFELTLPIGGSPSPGPSAQVDLRIDQLTCRGIDLHQLAVPLTIAPGRLQAAITAELNGGRLALRPQWAFAATQPLLTLPSDSEVLTGVRLDKTLMEEVLANIHPLFGVLLQPEGMVDLSFNAFSWPLLRTGPPRPTFSARLDLNEVRLGRGGALAEVLDLFGLGEEQLRLQDREISCEGRDGRVFCPPVRLMAGEAEMRLEGVMGMDGSLDYQLVLPVTESLVGREGLPLMEGVTVRVPIGGKTDAPRFDRKAMTVAIEDVVRQAAARLAETRGNGLLPPASGTMPRH